MKKPTLGFAILLAVCAGSPAVADCPADLAATQVDFEATMTRLEAVQNGTQAEKCAAYRSHVEIMTKAHGVFMRCLTGHDQRENALQLALSIGDYHDLIQRRCTP